MIVLAADQEEQRLQSLVSQVRILEAYLNEVSARENITGRAIIESRASLEAVKALTSTPSNEVLLPIGAGVLLNSAIAKPDKLFIDIGAGAVVAKTPEETAAFVEQRIKELETALGNIQQQKAQVENQLAAYRAAVNDIVEKARNET
ncbi:MAG: prefoldin subunit alpha [Thaumarchaeota archaeon]|nr:prefoldin subunit alpha [Nitrososphaerota archaeon]